MGKINLGGREFSLRYTIKDGIELRKTLNRPAMQIYRDLFGFGSDGKSFDGPDLEGLAVCISVGIRHEERATTDKVLRWLQEHLDNGKLIGEVSQPVFESLNNSRCFGFRMDLDEAEPGKAEPSETSPT